MSHVITLRAKVTPTLAKVTPTMPHVITLRAKVIPTLAKVIPTLPNASKRKAAS